MQQARIIESASPVKRLRDEPIVAPGSVAGYGPVFNAGLLHHGGRYHLFARAVREGYRPGGTGGPRFVDYVSDIVVFTSEDGHDYEFQYVLARAGDHGVDGFEDPRVQRVGDSADDAILMTYTNLPAPERSAPWRIGAHRLVWDGVRFHLDPSGGHLLGPEEIPNKDAVIFPLDDGRIALIHRIHPHMQLAVFDDLDHLMAADGSYWQHHLATLDDHVIIEAANGSLGVGAGAPPIRTEAGFLLFFHDRRADGVYTMNVALLDELTGRVRSMLSEPVLVPELEWERVGDVDDVVFVQGAHLDGDHLYLTYGAADRCVGAATASVRHLLAALYEPNHLVA